MVFDVVICVWWCYFRGVVRALVFGGVWCLGYYSDDLLRAAWHGMARMGAEGEGQLV